jgi:hypothetical protein
MEIILGDRWPLWIRGWGSWTYVADCPYQTPVSRCKTSSDRESDDQYPLMPMVQWRISYVEWLWLELWLEW